MKVLTDKELLIQKKDILFIGEYEELPVEVKCLLKWIKIKPYQLIGIDLSNTFYKYL